MPASQVSRVAVNQLVVPGGLLSTMNAGAQGEGLVSQIHGKYYNAALAGNVFLGATLAAGVVIPFIAATMLSKFALHNPAGSGKLVELIDINLAQVPGSALITGCAMAFQGPLATSGGPPTSVVPTLGGVASTRIGGGGSAPTAQLYTSAQLTNVAIANLNPVMILYNNVATTVITQQYLNYQFDGRVVLPPDTLCTLCDTITGTQSAAAISLTWAEWPLG